MDSISSPVDVAQNFLDRIRAAGKQVTGSSGNWRCQCPAHDGTGLSISVWENDDGSVGVRCYSHGCTTEEICRSVGLQKRDLFPGGSSYSRPLVYNADGSLDWVRSVDLAHHRDPADQRQRAARPDAREGQVRGRKIFYNGRWRKYDTSFLSCIANVVWPSLRLPGCRWPDVATPYARPDGTVDMAVLRWDLTRAEQIRNGKGETKIVRAITLTEAGWVYARKAAPIQPTGLAKPLPVQDSEGAVPYLPKHPDWKPVVDCDTAFIVEGEKAMHAVESIGLPALTWCGGSSAVAATDFTPLNGKRLIVIADNDSPGRECAFKLQCQFVEQCPDSVVKFIDIRETPDWEPSVGDDAADLIRHFWSTKSDTEIRAIIEALPQHDDPPEDETNDKGEIVRQPAKPTFRETRIEVHPPEPTEPLRHHRVEVDNGVSQVAYRDRIAEILNDHLGGPNRKPVVVACDVPHSVVLQDFLKAKALNRQPIRTVIAVDSVKAASVLAAKLDAAISGVDVAFYDHRRRQDDNRNDLPANCTNEQADIAANLGLSVQQAICQACVDRNRCKFKKDRETALLADHLVVTTGTLAFSGLKDSFGDRDLIFIVGDRPESIECVTAETTNAKGLADTLHTVGEVLKRSPQFQKGLPPGSPAVNLPMEKQARQLSDWHDKFFGQVLPFIQQHLDGNANSLPPSPPIIGRLPGLFARHIYAELAKFGRIGRDESYQPFLMAGQRASEILVSGGGLLVTLRNETGTLPIIAFQTEANADSTSHPVLRTGVTLSDQHAAAQHALPLKKGKKSDKSPKMFNDALRAILNDHQPRRALVITHRRFRGAVASEFKNDRRVADVITYHDSSVNEFDADLVVALGTPSASSRDVRTEAAKSGIDDAFGFGRVEIDLPTEIGGTDVVTLLTYESPRIMGVHADLIRRKMGLILSPATPKAVVVSPHFLGLPLAAESLIPECVTVAGIRRVLDEAETPLTGKMTQKRLKAIGAVLDRRHFAERIETVLSVTHGEKCLLAEGDSVSGFKYQKLRIRTECHPLLLNTVFIEPGDTLSGFGDEWFGTQEFGARLDCTDRTARRKLKSLLDAGLIETNGKKARACRYRLTQDGQAVIASSGEPVEFETAGGQRVTVIPPPDWNGSEPLYCRSDLLTTPESSTVWERLQTMRAEA